MFFFHFIAFSNCIMVRFALIPCLIPFITFHHATFLHWFWKLLLYPTWLFGMRMKIIVFVSVYYILKMNSERSFQNKRQEISGTHASGSDYSRTSEYFRSEFDCHVSTSRTQTTPTRWRHAGRQEDRVKPDGRDRTCRQFTTTWKRGHVIEENFS